MGQTQPSAGEPAASTLPTCETIEVRIAELKQLFNSMDASPFRERDLDPSAEEFIVGWAREAPRGAHLALLVELDRAPPPPGVIDEPAALREAIGEFFTHRAKASRSRLRQLLRIGRISLLVGLVFLVAAIGLGDLIGTAMKGQRLGELLRQGLVIIGWVAMWRPVEIFLYGWWPIRTEAKLYDRLSAMPVRIEYTGRGERASGDAWRRDWPAVPPITPPPQKTPPHAPPDAQTRGGGAGKANPIGPDTLPDRGPIAASLVSPSPPVLPIPEHGSTTSSTTR